MFVSQPNGAPIWLISERVASKGRNATIHEGQLVLSGSECVARANRHMYYTFPYRVICYGKTDDFVTLNII